MKKLLLGLTALLVVAAIFVAVIRTMPTNAQTTTGYLSGWAWSSNVGWLSASSTDAGAGGGPYGLQVDSLNNITGYMWSSGIGWIKFGGLSSFPSGGTSATNATLVLSTGAVNGWARACAGTASGNCSSMTSRSDGWDGWIELSGPNHVTGDTSGNGGVTLKTSDNTLVGYAWGGSVVGWIEFNDPAGPTKGVKLVSTAVAAYCSPSSPTNLSSAGNVTFTAYPSGGSGSYDYNWSGGGWGSNTTDTISYSTPGGFGPSLVVRDHNNQSLQATASPNCGNVTVAGVNSNCNQGSIALYIGNTSSSATACSLTITQSQPVVVKWVNSLPAGYTCTASVTPPPGQTAPSSFTSNWTGTNFTGTGSTAQMATNTSSPTGHYYFNLSCTDGVSGDPVYTPAANLIITNTSETEI